MDDIQYTADEWARNPSRASGPVRGLATKDMPIEFNFYSSGYIPNDEAWNAFFRDIDAGHLAEDERFASLGGRTAHKKELEADLEKAMASFTVDEVMKFCLKNGGMASPYHTLEAMANHPQTAANEMIVTVQHATLGELRMIGMPSWFHSSPSDITVAPPTLGQHTLDILREAAYLDNEIEDLLVQGAVA
jgi:crotonobetainyl-CoA:carnitine CoA-transferase CaiB-like acyl-CoA transferase